MAFEPFGLVGGLSVGIPPILVINDNGVATLNGLQVTGLSNLGPIGNVIITGGENGYFLQTDGAGHLTWAPGTGGNGGNGIPGGANTQVQFNNAGNFGGDAGFTYDSINNVLSVSGNIVSNNFIGSGNITIANINANGNVTANYFIGNGSQLTGVVSALANVANYAGNITVAAQPNITSVGTLTTLSVSGNVTANYYIGNGSLLTGIGNANYAPTANFANYAGNVTVSSQPNITSVGTLTTLSVAGNASVGNLLATAVVSNLIPNSNVTYNLGNSTNRWNDLYLSGNSVFLGDVTLSADGNGLYINGGTGNIISNNLSNIPGANVIGQVSNALVSGTVYSPTQPNITTVGTLISLAVTGNVTSGNVVGGNLVSANYLNGILTTSSSSQPNIHSVGNLGFLNVDTNLPGANGNITFNGSMSGIGSQSDISITGELTAHQITAELLSGSLTTNAQPNITSVGTLTGLTSSGNITATNFIGNFVGNLTGNISNANFASYAGNVTVASQPNITNVGTLTSLAVNGNIVAANITANTGRFAGNGSGLTQLTGSNVVGAVANATYAVTAGSTTTAGTVTTNAQPNITSVGTLTTLTTSGNITAPYFIGNVVGNISGNFVVPGTNTSVLFNQEGNAGASDALKFNYSSNVLTANGNIIANYFIGNLVGNIANANFASYAGNVTSSSQPNITSVGTLTSLTASGNITAPNFVGNFVGNATSANFASYAGNVTVSAQPNITSVGTLTSLSVTGNINANNVVAVNRVTATELSGLLVTASQPNITTLGTLTNLSVAGNIIGGNLVSANFLTGTLTTQTQANIHTVGNLGFLNVDTSLPGANGNITFNGSMSGTGPQSDISITGDLIASNIFATLIAGELTTNEQPNVTLLGTLTELNVNGPTDLGLVSNITIDGGSNGYVLSTNGSGNLSWVEQSGGGNTTPGGADTQIQYNDNGAFGGNLALTFNDTTKLLRIDGNIVSTNNIQANVLVSNVANGTAPIRVTSTTKVANLSVETANTATFANTAANANIAITVSNAAQPNITSVGNLTSLTVAGNIVVTGRGNITGNLNVGNLDTIGTLVSTTSTTTGNSTVNGVLQVGSTGSLKVLGNVNTASSSNVFLGNVENIHISGGINGYVLATDGFGNLSWSTGGGGGNGIPGGSNTQVQYNDNGAFGGSAFLTFNESTNTFQIAGNLVANTTQIGAGVYKFSTTSVYAATTSSTSPDQLLWSTLAANVSGIDFHIISTDLGSSTRQVSKISSVILGNIVQWNEYGSLLINGGVGSFDVAYSPGNIIVAPTVELRVTPDSTNTTSYKILITEYTP
jgi:hypothetical protein